MKIGIIGSGDVGKSLGRGLAAIGHNVMIGSQTPESEDLQLWKQGIGKHASTSTYADTARYGDILVVAFQWGDADEITRAVRPSSAGKVVIDVTNPLEFDGTTPRLAVGHDISGGEILQQLLPDSNVVKTLNYVSHNNMCQPRYYEGTPFMFYCGNNPAAKVSVRNILEGLGWKENADLGDIRQSRILEPLSLLWVTYGMVENTQDHAFSVLKR